MRGAGDRPLGVDASAGRGVQIGNHNTQHNYFFVTGAETANGDIFDHVPESNTEVEYVIGHRPQAWEYLMYAGLLQVGLRDARREGKALKPSQLIFSNSQTAVMHIRTLKEELERVIQETMDCFEPVLLSKALGEPGRPGEFRLIYDVAHRLVIAYEKFIDWSKSAQTAQVPRQARNLYSILGGFADRPVRDIEEYVTSLVAELNEAVHRASLGEHYPAVLKLECVIHADEGLVEEFVREAERVRLWMKKHPGE